MKGESIFGLSSHASAAQRGRWRGSECGAPSPATEGAFGASPAPSVIQRLRAVCHLPRFAWEER